MIGTITLATDQGLGYLAKAFYDNGIIDTVCVKKHSSRVNHFEWYPNHVDEEKLYKCSTLIFFETPFNWKIIPEARKRGIKTILIPMYECTQYPFPYEPDEIWCPSDLDFKFYKDMGKENIKRIQIPVDVEWKQRTTALKFVHNAGNGGLGGRNGTKELIEAFRHVKSPATLLIRSQVPLKCDNPKIEVRIGTFDDIWSDGDVFVFPEKFNGLSLPLQEAFASGMLVMATRRYPNTCYLPMNPLIPVESYQVERISTEFMSAVINPKEIAKQIDLFYNTNIENYSLLGLEYNKQNSWKTLKKTYQELLGM